MFFKLFEFPGVNSEVIFTNVKNEDQTSNGNALNVNSLPKRTNQTLFKRYNNIRRKKQQKEKDDKSFLLEEGSGAYSVTITTLSDTTNTSTTMQTDSTTEDTLLSIDNIDNIDQLVENTRQLKTENLDELQSDSPKKLFTDAFDIQNPFQKNLMNSVIESSIIIINLNKGEPAIIECINDNNTFWVRQEFQPLPNLMHIYHGSKLQLKSIGCNMV